MWATGLLLGLLCWPARTVPWGDAEAYGRVRSVIPWGDGSQVRLTVQSRGCTDSVCRVRAEYSPPGSTERLQFTLAVPAPYVEYSDVELLGFSPSWTRVVTAAVSLSDDLDGGMLARSVDEFLALSAEPIKNDTNSSLARELQDPGPPPAPFETNGSGTADVLRNAFDALAGAGVSAGRRRALLQTATEIAGTLTLTNITNLCTHFADAWRELKQQSLEATAELSQFYNLSNNQAAQDSVASESATVLADCLASSLTAISSKCLDREKCLENELQHLRYDLDLRLSNAYTTELLYLRNTYTREFEQFNSSREFTNEWNSVVDEYKQRNADIKDARDDVMELLSLVDNATTGLERQLVETASFYTELVAKHVGLVKNTTAQVKAVGEAVRQAQQRAGQALRLLLASAQGAEYLTERNRLFMEGLLEKAVSASAVWGSMARMLELIHTRAETKASLVRGLFSALQDTIEQGWTPLITDAGRRGLDLFDPATGRAAWYPVRGASWVAVRPVPASEPHACRPTPAPPLLLERRALWLECNLVPLSVEQQQYDSLLQAALLLGPEGCAGENCTCVLHSSTEVSTSEAVRQRWAASSAAAFAASLGVNRTVPTPGGPGVLPWLSPEGWAPCSELNETGAAAATERLRTEFCRPAGGGGGGGGSWLLDGFCGRAAPDEAAWRAGGVGAEAQAELEQALAAYCAAPRALNSAWVNAANSVLQRRLAWPYLEALLGAPGLADREASALERQLGAACAVSPGEYVDMVAETGGSALGVLRLLHRGGGGPPPDNNTLAAAEAALTLHPALQFWDELVASVPRMRRQAEQLKALAQGELPSPVRTSTRRGRRDLAYGPQASRGRVTLNAAGQSMSGAPQLQQQEDEASAAVASADVSELWLLRGRRAAATAYLEPGNDGTVEVVRWTDMHERLLGPHLYFAGYPYCLDKPCPLRATVVDAQSGIVRAYRALEAPGAPSQNATSPFGTASYSDAPPGLAPYVHDVPAALLRPLPWLAAREHTPLYLFEPVPAQARSLGGGPARAAAWLSSTSDWFAALGLAQREQYLSQWGGLVRLPLRAEGLSRFVDSVRNPFASGSFDPRAADVCLGQFQAPLEVQAAPTPDEVLAELAAAAGAADQLRREWLASLDRTASGLRLRNRRCRLTRTTGAGGLCAILAHYYLHWPRNGAGVRFYPKGWELEVVLRLPFTFTVERGAAPEFDGLRYCPQQLELATPAGGTTQQELRVAYTTTDPASLGGGCVLQVRADGCPRPLALALAGLAQYQTRALDLTGCAPGPLNVTLTCPGRADVLCLSDRTGAAEPPRLAALTNNAQTLRLQQQSELMPWYRRLGESISWLSASLSTPLFQTQLEEATAQSLAAYSFTGEVGARAQQWLSGLEAQATDLLQDLDDYANQSSVDFGAIYAGALASYQELQLTLQQLRYKQSLLGVLYARGDDMLAGTEAALTGLQQLSANISVRAGEVISQLQTALDLRWSVDAGVSPADLAAFLNISMDFCLYRLKPRQERIVYEPCLSPGASVFWFTPCRDFKHGCFCTTKLVLGALGAALMCASFVACAAFGLAAAVLSGCRGCRGCRRRRQPRQPDKTDKTAPPYVLALGLLSAVAGVLGFSLLTTMLALPEQDDFQVS